MPDAGAVRRVGAVLVAVGLLVLLTAAASGARVSLPRTWPFAPPDSLRSPKKRALPRLWGDGLACSTGCRAPGAIPGWPIRPFRRQHVLRAGLNELRPGNLHSGVDIMARDGTPVYAIQPGTARVLAATGRDARVKVGNFIYWHIRPRVANGQHVRPYQEVVGTVLRGQSHVHLSEVVGGRFVNPLRPGGRVLSPWRDSARPVLGRPIFRRRGAVLIRGFDPQSHDRRRAPVLALAALAYRLRNEQGRPVGRLRFAFRGSQHLPNAFRRAIYARGSRPAFAPCAMLPRPCRSHWTYRLAGGLAPRLRPRSRRVYTLTAYAWDWKGNVSAIDRRVVYVRGEPYVSVGR
jgi:hypothetical protein